MATCFNNENLNNNTPKNIPRRHSIPIIYTRGTHYDVGYDVGRTFGSLIHNFLKLSGPLNEVYLPLYHTPDGRKVYNDTLESVKKSFPQYIRELEGTADGAQVEFHKLFLLHMDEITPNAVEQANSINQPIGCSTICVNQPNNEFLGHTEDALPEVLNHFYFVSAHIICDKPEGKYNITEERFTSLCYAGHLPGYTMNYNHHGLVFSINTLSAKVLNSGKTPRHFLTRALLSAENFLQAQEILRDSGVGAADGCSVNMTFLKQEGNRLFHNAEMGPTDLITPESQLNILTASHGETIIHCNKYLRLKIPEVKGLIIDSSIERMVTFSKYDLPKNVDDIIRMLGDSSSCVHPVFRDTDSFIKTVAVGIFDCIKKTWTLYANNPKYSEPLVVLPLVIKE